MTQDEQRQAEESRVYDHDGSVRPSRDTGYRVGMPCGTSTLSTSTSLRTWRSQYDI